MTEMFLAGTKSQYIPASSRILTYVGLGEIDKAFEWKERAFDERDTGMVWMKILHFEDGIRSDPRFKAMLKKMNLDE